MASTTPIKLVGYILPEKEDEVAVIADGESENKEEVEDQQPELLDTNEMASVSSGGFVFQRNLPALTEVDFMFQGQKHRVKGRFVLKNPWWEISCTAKEFNCRLEVNTYQKMASYKLRKDFTVEGRSLLPLFLKECGLNPEFVMDFMKWLPEDRCVDLFNVQEALSHFGESNKDKQEETNYARSAVSKSDAGFYVRAATMYPHVMEYLPRLLPGQFLNLLQIGKNDEKQEKSGETEVDTPVASQEHGSRSVLASLEEVLKMDPWKLGFNYIMLTEFKIVRCEATLVAFKNCGLYSQIHPEKQDALQVYEHLKLYCRKYGHTYIDFKSLEKSFKISIWNAVEFLCQRGVLIKDKQKLALRNLYQYEMGIAQCLRQLTTKEPWSIDLDVSEVLRSAQCQRLKAKTGVDSTPSSPEKTGEDDDEASSSTDHVSDVNEPMDEKPEIAIELDPDQVRAAEMMCANAVTVVSGKGGCGKTTVVSLVFKAAMKNINKKLNSSMLMEDEEKKKGEKPPIKVLITAPTGRAAALLTKRTDSKAYTMHQVWWSYKNTEKDSCGQPKDWMFAHVQVLVVDEGSLVSVQVLHLILSILTDYADLKKIVILGDIRQLPSIEPGNVLSDLFTSLKKANWAIEMHKNHRSESKSIVENAGLIADIGQKKMAYQLNFDAIVDLSKNSTLPSNNNRFIQIISDDDDALQDSIRQLLKGPAPGLEDDKCSQFVTFTRVDCDMINVLCCKHYSDHITKNHKKKLVFQKGDKVCCTRNGYVSYIDLLDNADGKDKVDEEIKKEEQQKKERLCNGEIFFITEDVTEEEAGLRSKRRFLTLDDKEGRVLKVDYSELMKECKLRHAWARTIHTFQGSEAETVVYVLSKKYENWKHVYTAVTRGRSRVYIIANKHNLELAVRKQDIPRNTRLAGFVKEVVHDLGVASEDWPSQSQFNTPRREPSIQKCHMQFSPSPGPSQTYHSMLNQCANETKDAALQNMTNVDTGYGSPNTTPSGSPCVCKRQGSTDNSPSPTKQLKMGNLSLLPTKKLFQ